jgi:hypothetical protein
VSQEVLRRHFAAGKRLEERYELLGVVDAEFRVGKSSFEKGGKGLKGSLVIGVITHYRSAGIELDALWNVTRQHALYETSTYF